MTELERLKSKYQYDSITGIMYNEHGESLTCLSSGGYIRCNNTYVHRLAWYIHYNEIPNYIDHINGDKTDNRIVNLRSVTPQKNSFNMHESKVCGFQKRKNGRFTSRIILNKKYINLGTYDTEQEAHQAYLDAKKIYHII